MNKWGDTPAVGRTFQPSQAALSQGCCFRQDCEPFITRLVEGPLGTERPQTSSTEQRGVTARMSIDIHFEVS
jgi:hypothetical protein